MWRIFSTWQSVMWRITSCGLVHDLEHCTSHTSHVVIWYYQHYLWGCFNKIVIDCLCLKYLLTTHTHVLCCCCPATPQFLFQCNTKCVHRVWWSLIIRRAITSPNSNTISMPNALKIDSPPCVTRGFSPIGYSTWQIECKRRKKKTNTLCMFLFFYSSSSFPVGTNFLQSASCHNKSSIG